MTNREKGNWKARILTDHVCVLCQGGFRINGINVTVYMDNDAIFVIKDHLGKIIDAKELTFKEYQSAKLNSIKWICGSVERTAVFHNKFFKPRLRISTPWLKT